MSLMQMRWDAKYDMSGRRRKQKKPKGEVAQKFDKSKARGVDVGPGPYRRDEGVVYKSLPMGAGTATKKETQQYTGTLVKGLGQLHKSNLVPILNEQEAIDIANMRRTQ